MNDLSENIEVNLREYLYAVSGSLNKEDNPALDGLVQNQVRDAFDALEGDRAKLALSSYLRETAPSIDLGFLDGLRGVVVEFGVEGGTDVFAGYSGGVAAWYDNASSKMVEVELKGKSRINLDGILLAAKKISDVATASNALPLQPSAGFALISLINADGISFGLGASREMAVDGICGPIIQGALAIRKEILSLN